MADEGVTIPIAPAMPEGFHSFEPAPIETEPEPPSGFRLLEEEERVTLGFEPLPPAPEPEPNTFQRLGQRFLGTDVDDPQELPRLGTIILGAVVGGVAGSKIPTLPGPAGVIVNPVVGTVVFGTAGAVAGAAAPEAIMEAGEALGILEPGTREREGLSPEDLKTVMEGEALLELATGGGITIIRGAGRLATRALAGGDRAVAEAGARQGIDLIPVQVGGRPIANGFVAVMGRFPWIGAPIRKGAEKAEQQIQTAIRGLPDRLGPIASWSEISETIYQDARSLVNVTNKVFREKYTALWARADELGVRVIPAATLAKADEIFAKIGAQTPQAAPGQISPQAPGKAMERLLGFINENVAVLRGEGGSVLDLQRQSLRQMDGLVSAIDQEIATLEPGQKRFILSQLNQLRQAAQLDSIANVRGVGADEIARGLKELDAEFSHTMSQLFSTATAKKFGSVRRRGLRAIEFDEATRTPVDQLARLVVKLDSPQQIDELSRLIEPETFNRIGAKILDDASDAAYRAAGGDLHRFDVDAFAKYLGLEKGLTNKRKSIEAMLEKSGSDLTIGDLDDLVEAGRAISHLEIPNASTFIARRATIGGVQSLINGLVPGLAITAGATWAGGSLVGVAAFVGSGRLISKMLSNPDSAKALKRVLDKEASTIVKREATIRALRFGLNALADEENWTEQKFDQLWQVTMDTIRAYDRQIRDLE